MAPDSLDSATKQDWTTDIIMFLLWLCHVSPLAELHPCIHNQRTPNFAVYNHTYIYIYICIYIYLYICVCVCVCASGPWRSWSQAQPRGRRQGAEPLNNINRTLTPGPGWPPEEGSAKVPPKRDPAGSTFALPPSGGVGEKLFKNPEFFSFCDWGMVIQTLFQIEENLTCYWFF